MRHALFFAFHYPPEAGSSGVLRTLKYSRYLADHGWRVTVVSPDTSAYDSIDTASLKEVPGTVKVVRTRYLNTQRHLAVRGRYLALTALPDRFIGWLPWAVAAGGRVHRDDPVDLIYSTSPPATAHLAAGTLARRLGKPWIADFRDPWFEDVAEPGAPDGAAFRRLDRWLERRVVTGCSRVVATTTGVRDMLAARHGHLPDDKFGVIANGFDEADFSALSTTSEAPNERLCIAHAGSINPHFRDPMWLLEPLQAACRQGSIDPDKVLVQFLGGGEYAESPALRAALADSGLSASVQVLARVPYADALKKLAAADVLLLLQASEDTRALVPAKLYEYLRMAKPVLALTLPGEISSLLQQTGGGFAVEPQCREQVTSVLIDIYRRWQQGVLGSHVADQAVVRRYDRRALAGQLAAVFDRAAVTRAG